MGLGVTLVLNKFSEVRSLLRKEVIHPHLPVGIPCYDLTLVIDLAVVALPSCELKTSTSGVANFTHLTGSVLR